VAQLACAALVVKSNNVLGRARQVGDDEAVASNVEASPGKQAVVLLARLHFVRPVLRISRCAARSSPIW
jgi:hypothetical protein